MNKPKLLFLYDMPAELQANWRDGLWAALNLLEKDFEITKYNVTCDTEGWKEEYDVVLAWGGFNSVPDLLAQQKKAKKVLCLGGYIPINKTVDNYDLIFYETGWSRKWLELQHITKPKLMHAFGINTDIFYSRDDLLADDVPDKLWDYITIGYFSFFKRQLKLLEKKGSKLAVGKFNSTPESVYVVSELLSRGCTISSEVPPEKLADLYRASKICYIPGTMLSGGERAILEARACGIEVEVEIDNLKLLELTKSPIWDQVYYANKLKEGILSIL